MQVAETPAVLVEGHFVVVAVVVEPLVEAEAVVAPEVEGILARQVVVQVPPAVDGWEAPALRFLTEGVVQLTLSQFLISQEVGVLH